MGLPVTAYISKGKLRLAGHQPFQIGVVLPVQQRVAKAEGRHLFPHHNAVHDPILGAAGVAGVQVREAQFRLLVRLQHGPAVDGVPGTVTADQ